MAHHRDHSPPEKDAKLLNTDRSREAAHIDHRIDDDGFWRFGYGNDPRRRRYVRRVEKQKFRNSLDFC